MTPELRTDDLDRIREVERGVAACNVTLAEHGQVLDHQSQALARIEASLKTSLKQLTELSPRVTSLEGTRSNLRSAGKWTAGVVGSLIVGLILFFITKVHNP